MTVAPPDIEHNSSAVQEQRISPKELRTIFTHTRGMLLSQVCSLSNLEGTTIQNWVKRGLVPPPEKKLYELRTVARILIVDLLRDCLTLEHIAFLLGCINGEIADVSDDLLPEEELYALLYELIRTVDADHLTDVRQTQLLIQQALPQTIDPKARQRLTTTVCAMLLAHSSVRLKHLAEAKIAELQQTTKASA